MASGSAAFARISSHIARAAARVAFRPSPEPSLPAFATSKSKAASKALQKQTAAEAKQAMKEYKFAPRPVLEGNAETGYAYKAGTVTAGSQGELAGYFKGALARACLPTRRDV